MSTIPSNPFYAGSTFWVNGADGHLNVIISDPSLDSERILYVNMTSYDPLKNRKNPFNDPSCIIDVGEHQFITKLTCICYAGAREVSMASLQNGHSKGKYSFSQPVSSELLERIRKCASDSLHMEIGHYEILVDQKLV